MDQIEGPWSPEQDQMLLNLVEKHGSRNWILIGMYIPGRSGKSCLLRWISLQLSFTPEEDEMLQNLVDKHGRNWSLIGKSIPGKSEKTCKFRWFSLQRSFKPEEDKMLQNLVDKHGPNWSLISKSCETRWETLEKQTKLRRGIADHWDPTLKGKSISLTNEDITISDHNVFIQPPSVSDINRGQMNSYIHDLNLSLALGGVCDQAPSIGDMARDNVSQPSGGFNRMPTLKNLFPLSGHERPQQELKKIAVLDKQNIYTTVTSESGSQNSNYQGNSRHDVGGVVSGHQPPSISDMVRGNMSSGGTHSFSRDHSTPSWNALNIRDSSPMMIDSDSVQQFVGGEFGRNDFSEVSSTSIVQGMGW